ncbi:hypothetical protein [Nocardia sp. NPDC057227]|uniref:hypothetical protein n=1 Tax=Nocardia sp. NPDC057227 TaxID=3346056 RepID=UPI00363C4E28
MSTEPAAGQPDPVRGGAQVARARGEPRSTLWRVAVGTTPVVATALTLEFGRTLVVDSFGETEVVRTLASTLRALWILLVIGGVLFAGYRWYSQRQDGERLERTRALLDSLDGPDVAVEGIPSQPGTFAVPVTSARNPTEAAVFQLLPARRYDSAILLAVAAALSDAAHSLRRPGAPAPAFGTATELCAQLLHDQVLAVSGAHYYPTVRRTAPEGDEVLEKSAWATALCALVRAHADRASARAVALGHPGHVVAARAWFDGAEVELRDLVTGAISRGNLPMAVLPELIRVVDALDVYYGHDSRGDDLRALLTALDDMPKFPLHAALLRLRANPAADVLEHHRPLAWATAVAARRRHSLALEQLRDGGDPAMIVRDLQRVWRLVPRADLSAEVCVLINLAVAELRRDGLEAAGDRLELALARTEDGRDPGGRVHATEIRGILHWMLGRQVAAVQDWQTAWTGYRDLADPRGQGRCLRHLGSALNAAPALGGGAVAPETGQPLRRDHVFRQARGWLTEAERLDPGNPVAPPPLPMGPPLPPLDRPPLDRPDPHLRIARRT